MVHIRRSGGPVGTLVAINRKKSRNGHFTLIPPKEGRRVVCFQVPNTTLVTRCRADGVAKPSWRPAFHGNTILLHRLAESELPHSLAFVGTKYTDVPPWKVTRQGRKRATDSETDEELQKYCCDDVSVTDQVVTPLIAEVTRHEQTSLVPIDHAVQRVCCDMHEVGMYVDQKAREVKERELIADVLRYRAGLQSLSKNSTFNPASPPQVGKLLFKEWDLIPPLDDELRFTATGAPATGDVVLRSLLLTEMEKPQRKFIFMLRAYRKVMKELGTYVAKLRPRDRPADLGWDDDENPEVSAERESRGYEKRGIVWPDGRMRPGYSAHRTVSGRLSSSSPINAQNFPSHLRKLVVPQKGHVLVGADADQIELRIAASRWNLRKYLQAFSDGIDPHSMVTAKAIFEAEFMNCKGWPCEENSWRWEGDAYRFRQLAKIIQYAFQYKASVETGARIIQATEIPDPETGRIKLPYLKMKVRKVRQMREAWLAGIPNLERGWNKEIQFFRQHHYVVEHVHGRRRLCLDGENPNEIVNFGIQCYPAGMRILCDQGLVPIGDLAGNQFSAWTGKKWAPATAFSKGNAPLYRVTTRAGFSVECDGSHGFKVVGKEGYEWRAAAGVGLPPLVLGDRVALNLARPFHCGNSGLSPEDAWVLGFWAGNGSAERRRTNGEISFFVGKGREGRREGKFVLRRLQDWARKEEGGERLKEHKGHWHLTLTGLRGGRRRLEALGLDTSRTAHTKRVPETVWRGSLEARRHFLTGLLDADGYFSSNRGIVLLNLCQLALVEEVALLARSVGVSPNYVKGPYVTDKKGHTCYRVALNAELCRIHLGWGSGGKLRTRASSSVPMFEHARCAGTLGSTCNSDRVVRSRIRCRLREGTSLNVSPYMLLRMGAQDLYDHDEIVAIESLDREEEVYTLCVDDPDHQYVGGHFLAKNSSASALMNTAMIAVHKEIPLHRWGPGTGLLTQTHDSLVVECPEDQAQYVKEVLEHHLNQTHPNLPGVKFTATAEIGTNWKAVG